MKPTRGPRRVLGLRLPYVMATVVDVGEKAGKLIADCIADPRGAIESQIQGIQQTLDDERRRATETAVSVGERLLWLRLNPGDEGFAAHVARLGISGRSARNKMALALFAAAHPELYEKLKILGPSKLYRIAVLRPEKVRQISVDDPVETPRGKVLLRQLTSREFEVWVRDQLPAPKTESWVRRAHRHLRRSERTWERNAGRPVDVADLRLLAGSLERFKTWLQEELAKWPE
jgi:hypothetical protein